jgi:hypothetical protein
MPMRFHFRKEKFAAGFRSVSYNLKKIVSIKLRNLELLLSREVSCLEERGATGRNADVAEGVYTAVHPIGSRYTTYVYPAKGLALILLQ